MQSQITDPVFYFLIFAVLIWFAGLISRVQPVDHDSSRNKKLEGLRGLLAPSVMIYHGIISYFYYVKGGVWTLPPSTFLIRVGTGPVVVFFFLTGFLFWRQELTRKANSWNYKVFLLRRFRRLAPAFYLLIVGLFLTALAISDWTLKEPSKELFNELFSWLFFGLPFGDWQNINKVKDTLIFVAGVVWSIRFEWLYYLFFPVIRKFANFKETLFCLALAILTWLVFSSAPVNEFVANHRFFGKGFDTIAAFSKFLAFGFGIGMVSAFSNLPQMGYFRPLFNLLFRNRWSQWIIIVLIGIYTQIPVTKWDPIVSAVFLGLPFLSIVFADASQWTVLEKSSLQLLGQISYGIYLFHGLILFWAFWLFNREIQPVVEMNPITIACLIALVGGITLIFATLSFKMLEVKFISKKVEKS